MKIIPAGILSATLLGAASLSAAAEIDVMTQNQISGADLTPVLGATTSDPCDPCDPVAFNAAVVDTLKRIAAMRSAERAQALAAEITERQPDVVGLQEVFKFDCLTIPVSLSCQAWGATIPRSRLRSPITCRTPRQPYPARTSLPGRRPI